MKKIFIALILALTFTVSKATEKEIIAEVIFENLTGKELNSGEFFITETNERIEIKDTQSFKITLPSKGKYQFGFATDEFTAYTYYPSRITNNKYTITIRLVEKTELTSKNRSFSFPMNLDTNLSDEQIEKRISEGNLNFIIHGIDNSIPKAFLEFKEKYGIGLTKENCVIDPLSFKKATENNQMIADYLNKKYGVKWMNELPTKPFGVK
ncbi:FEKKY domain-containing protein [Formosa sp. 3Alg 14/1]|uniref:FEKKY domain-containing protein n=1 Tax=Formosa sp. 3Alg 14/1 TaxID=3382190 RepID=UPI0039BDC9AC